MAEISESNINSLRVAVEEKFGRKLIYPKDCMALSLAMNDDINRQLSETTLKRIWGLVSSDFAPSKYTLDSLAIYAGYHSWEDFLVHKSGVKEDLNWKIWDKIKNKAISTSTYSFESIVNRMSSPYENTIHRKSIEKRIDEFINSDKTATALIAPGGYGKSTIIAKLVEKLFLCKNPKYPNDIVWFIDCGIIDPMITKDFNIESFLVKLMGYDSQDNFRKYFQKNNQYLKGRIILIVDGLNELSANTENLNVFIDNIIKLISTNGDTTWFKIILTCRVHIWNYIIRKTAGSPSHREKWFDVEFEFDDSISINIPKLADNEIEQILKINKSLVSLEKIRFNNYELIDIISIPYFLHLYITLTSDEEYISDIDLLNKFLRQNITESNDGIGKVQILDSFLESTQYGIDTNIADKKKIEAVIEQNQSAYKELVSYGILREYEVETKYLEKTICIKISHQILFEFLLANYWIRTYKIKPELLRKINEYYINNSELRSHILGWTIKFAFKEEKIDVLKNIYKFFNDYLIKDSDKALYEQHINSLINLVGHKLRLNEKLREALIPHFALNKEGQKFYFEKFWDMDYLNIHFSTSIDHYIRRAADTKRLLFGNVIKFWGAFFMSDLKQMELYFDKLNELDISDCGYSAFNLYLNCQILYQQRLFNKIQPNLLEFVMNHEVDSVSSKIKPIDFNYEQIAVIDALGMCENKNQDVIKLIQLKEKCCTSPETMIKVRFYRFMMISYALAHLRLGDYKTATVLFENYKLSNTEHLPINSRYFWLIRYTLIEAEFFIALGSYSDAKQKLKKVVEYAGMLKYNYFEIKAKDMLKMINVKELY